MTWLVVSELRDSLTQELRIRTHERQKVQAIRPNIYVHNDPAGDLTLRVKRGATVVGESTQTIATMKTNMLAEATGAGDYLHGYVNFEFTDLLILEKGVHTIEIEGQSGYTFTEFDYIGWVRPHEHLENTVFDPENLDDVFYNPFGFQMWGLRRGKCLEY